MTNIFVKARKRLTTPLERIPLRKIDANLWDYLVVFFRQCSQDSIVSKANSMAFNFTLAIFPGLIFLFTLIPYFPIPDLQVRILEFLSNVIPTSIYKIFRETIEDIISKQRGGLLSFGFVFALYAAMNGTVSMITAFNECYKTYEKRSFIHTRLVALSITIINVLVLIVSIAILVAGEAILDYLLQLEIVNLFSYLILTVLRYFIVIAAFFFLIAFIYYLAPSIKKRWSFFSPGVFVATFLNILVTIGFSAYINNFSNYNKLYGSIGTILALMLWMQVTSIVILVGFEINAVCDDFTKKEVI